MDMFQLNGELALVTGGSRGIGLGIARALAEAGARVILVGRDAGSLASAAASIPDNAAVAEPYDLSAVEGIPAWYDALVERQGTPTILVNAAGVTVRAPAENLPLADWDAVIRLNLTAVFVLAGAFARRLFEKGSPGRIINIASLMTFAARRGTAAYTASKGGIGQLTKVMAVDWADRGILVNAIAPGFVDTAMTAPLVNDPAFDQWVKQRCPLGRWSTPEDLAWPAVFLASPASAFITGQVLYVDGGWTSTF